MGIKTKLVAWLSSPRTLRVFFWVARGLFPAVRLRGTWMVFRDADVREVLDSDDRFSVIENYAARMQATSGAFFLGMDDSPRYQREHAFAAAALQSAGRNALLEAIATQTRLACADLVGRSEFDLIGVFTRRVPLRLVQGFFGVPGPDDATLERWLRIQFWELFLNFGSGDPDVTRRAQTAAREMNAYLDAWIAERRAALSSGAPAQSFLDHLIRLHSGEFADLGDDAIRRNVAGVVIGAVDTQSKALVFALRELKRRRSIWDAAVQSARAGQVEACMGFALEALRFDPHNPLIIRNARLDTTLRSSSRRPKRIGRGERVMAWTLSAGFDSRAVDHPRRFDPSRSPEHYLHFGGGIHRCFGYAVASRFLGEALCALLAAGDLEFLGEIAFEGPFPDSWRARLRQHP